jgi:hypothetical protein
VHVHIHSSTVTVWTVTPRVLDSSDPYKLSIPARRFSFYISHSVLSLCSSLPTVRFFVASGAMPKVYMNWELVCFAIGTKSSQGLVFNLALGFSLLLGYDTFIIHVYST